MKAMVVTTTTTVVVVVVVVEVEVVAGDVTFNSKRVKRNESRLLRFVKSDIFTECTVKKRGT
jgi:hypothetical protein